MFIEECPNVTNLEGDIVEETAGLCDDVPDPELWAVGILHRVVEAALQVASVLGVGYVSPERVFFGEEELGAGEI